jgi:hypothetical protein
VRAALQLSPPAQPALRARAVEVALTDPIKEFCQSLYAMDDITLWGCAQERDRTDPRYARRHDQHIFNNGDSLCARCHGARSEPGCTSFLSAREALQHLGGLTHRLWPGTLSAQALARAQELLALRTSHPDKGTFQSNWKLDKCELVVIDRLSYVEDAEAIAAAGGEVWQIRRPGSPVLSHETEAEQARLAPLVTATIDNDGSIGHLRERLHTLLEARGY